MRALDKSNCNRGMDCIRSAYEISIEGTGLLWTDWRNTSHKLTITQQIWLVFNRHAVLWVFYTHIFVRSLPSILCYYVQLITRLHVDNVSKLVHSSHSSRAQMFINKHTLIGDKPHRPISNGIYDSNRKYSIEQIAVCGFDCCRSELCDSSVSNLPEGSKAVYIFLVLLATIICKIAGSLVELLTNNMVVEIEVFIDCHSIL